MIQMRLVVGVDAVIADRGGLLDCLEELRRAPAREYGYSVCRGVDFVSGICNNSLHVPIEAVTLGATRRPSPGERLEFAMKIRRLVGRASVLIRLSVQVDAQHRKCGGLESHQPCERLFYRSEERRVGKEGRS